MKTRAIKRISIPLCLVSLFILWITAVDAPQPVAAVPSGAYFDHIVIIAMENTPYASVFGSGTISGCPTSSARFLCSMLPYSSTLPSMNNYGATSSDANDFNGCSAACYVGLLAGYTYGVTDGYGSLTASNLVADRLAPAGLTWQAYCAEGCPRGNDHFPFTSFADTASSSNIFTSSSVTISSLISAANSASPPNFLWYTPTDSENMHDVSVSTGDSYLQTFLVGSGNISSPASGSLLASNLFTNPNFHSVLYLWWDECGGGNGSCDSNNDVPNLIYGTPVKKGYASSDTTGIDEYASLWTIENNWALSPLARGDTTARTSGYAFNDIFGTGGSSGLAGSFSYSPSAVRANATITFWASASGGTGPYTYAWNFGDGATATGSSATHAYSGRGTYTVTMTTTDNTGQTSVKTQEVTVGGTSSPGGIFMPTLSILTIGLILGGVLSVTIFLAKYHSHNQRLKRTMENRNSVADNEYYSEGSHPRRAVQLATTRRRTKRRVRNDESSD